MRALPDSSRQTVAPLCMHRLNSTCSWPSSCTRDDDGPAPKQRRLEIVGFRELALVPQISPHPAKDGVHLVFEDLGVGIDVAVNAIRLNQRAQPHHAASASETAIFGTPLGSPPDRDHSITRAALPKPVSPSPFLASNTQLAVHPDACDMKPRRARGKTIRLPSRSE